MPGVSGEVGNARASARPAVGTMSATAKGSSLEKLICPEPWGRPPGAWCARLASRLALLCGGLSCGLGLPSLVAEIHTGKCVWIPSWDPRSTSGQTHPSLPSLPSSAGAAWGNIRACLCTFVWGWVCVCMWKGVLGYVCACLSV